MVIRQFDGVYTEATPNIARETDPWVGVDGVPYDWMARPLPDAPDNDCEICRDSPVSGALQAMNTPAGIERCDECEVFEGDLDAAFALAALVGGTVYYESEEKS